MNETAGLIYTFSALRLDGSLQSLEDFRGQVLVIVNTASHCGFTPQYAALEEIFRLRQHRGFSVLGFPCNQFGSQEPGSGPEIGQFCQKNYGVSFPVFAKVEVNGPAAHPLFVFLKQQQPGLFSRLFRGRIGWNFTKFLVDRHGTVVARLSPSTRPESLAPAIDRLLDRSG